MSILLKTRCTEGHLVIYEDKVSIERLFGVGNTVLLRNQITGVEMKMTQANILGMGQAMLTIHTTGNNSIEVKRVKYKDAQRAQEILSNS